MKRLQFCLRAFMHAHAVSGRVRANPERPVHRRYRSVGCGHFECQGHGDQRRHQSFRSPPHWSGGPYKFNELPAGTYQITAEAAGLQDHLEQSLALNAGTIQRADFNMQLGQTREVIEVTGEAAAVNTEDSKLANTVAVSQVANLPLNGRNVYDLIQLAPGAVNVRGVMSENGANTVVNGLREDFNGFLINGSSNKGLSGGAVNQPIEDTVQEFQELTLNMSAQYGNSAGSVTNLITKSGTNQYHGSGWYFGRNDFFDSNDFFANQTGTPEQALRFNQFGGTFGGASSRTSFSSSCPTRTAASRVQPPNHGHGGDAGIPASRHCRAAEFNRRLAVQELRADTLPDMTRMIMETYYGSTRSAESTSPGICARTTRMR